eukprot:CAMPEP_0194282644 /NCGR_PEP_ID=MMETSP0169-20130528/23557_1 /TAXON_ID=218684 /ORGANISM="Corethron pennatum, Strain L29A3" /LENGTH=539 /DNA_ID=CAMNT_0039028031 /DNA_START=274 /DNA_END=1893 /DNA_ORIENTATION=-
MFFKTKTRIEKIVEGIQFAETGEDAEFYLQEANVAFRHDDESRHDEEISEGAATTLYKRLALELRTNGSDKNVKLTTVALSMVYKCSKPALVDSFEDIGSGLLTVFLQLIKVAIDGKAYDSCVALKHVTRTILIFSQVNELKNTLVRHDGLVRGLVRVVNNREIADARVDAMHAIAFLIFEDTNIEVMARIPGLLDMLTEVAVHKDEKLQIRQWSGAAMWNLACCPSNKVILASHLSCLRAILFLLKTTCSVTIGYAVSIVKQLATEDDNKLIIVNYNNGSLLRALVSIATKDNVGLPNLEITHKAVHALYYLISNQTAVDACKHSPLSDKNTGLMVTLTSLVIDSPDTEVREAALSGLTTISIALSDGTCQFETLLQCLVKLLNSGRVEPTTMALAAFRKISAEDQNHFGMVNCLGLLETIGGFILHNAEIGHSERMENAMALDVLLSLTSNGLCCAVVADTHIVLRALEQILRIPKGSKIQKYAFKIVSNLKNIPDAEARLLDPKDSLTENSQNQSNVIPFMKNLTCWRGGSFQFIY